MRCIINISDQVCSCVVAASQPPAAPTTTPLLEALKAEKSAQKDKEAIFRSHAHYKDSTAATTSRKEESKKKATPATVASQKHSEAAQAPLSRKAKKAAAAQKATSPAQTARVTPAAKSISADSANLPAKPPPNASTTRTTPRSPRTARQQAPKVPATAPLPPKPVAQPAPSVTTEPAPPVPSASGRKGRPVVGLGRHFEAALNGAVGPSGGKKREKEALPGPVNVALQKDVPSKSKDVSPPSLGVPNILQRGEGHASGGPVIMQRPHLIPVDEPLIGGLGNRRHRGRGRGVPAPPRGG